VTTSRKNFWPEKKQKRVSFVRELWDDSVQRYLEQISSIQALSREEEQELFQRIETAKANIRRSLLRFGIVYESYMAEAQGVIDGTERFASVVADKGVPKRKYKMGLRGLMAQIEEVHAKASAAYGRMVKKEGSKASGFTKFLHQLIELYGQLSFKHSVVETFTEHIDQVMAEVAELERQIEASGGTAEELSKREEYELRLWMNHDEMKAAHQELQHWVGEVRRARDKIAESYLRLVVYMVIHSNQYHNQGLSLWDLIQEGNTGLMKAVDKFDSSRGLKLSTYAPSWIHKEISRAIENKGTLVRLPVYMSEEISKLKKVQEILAQELGREATPEEIAEELNWDVKKVMGMLEATQQTVTLDEADDFVQASPEVDSEQ
jgi:RNA polymerase primary sigma factor